MKNKKFIKDILEIIISVGIITFILLKFVLLPCRVDGTSMYPTLHDGDFGYSLICTRKISGLERFDIVVVDVGDKLLVKRLIGLPNETVEYKDNKLYINGVFVEEDFLNGVETNDFTVTLDENHYYCLGDNREVSKDSRYYGPFDESQVVSNHIMVFYPFNDFGYRD